jgi:hypothetical protein
MSDLKAFVAWACRVAGCSERQIELVVMIYGEGYTQGAAAAAMGLTVSKAGEYAREGIRRLQVSEWDDHELLQWDRVIDAAQAAHGEESLIEHARGLLDAVRNSQDPTPRTIDYDSNGRPIGGRSPLVDLDAAVRICRDLEAVRKKPATKFRGWDHNAVAALAF